MTCGHFGRILFLTLTNTQTSSILRSCLFYSVGGLILFFLCCYRCFCNYSLPLLRVLRSSCDIRRQRVHWTNLLLVMHWYISSRNKAVLMCSLLLLSSAVWDKKPYARPPLVSHRRAHIHYSHTDMLLSIIDHSTSSLFTNSLLVPT